MSAPCALVLATVADLEPQLTGTWNHNQDHPWSESGGDFFNIHYKSYSDNFLQTSWPSKSHCL